MAKIKKKKAIVRKNFSHWAVQICQNQGFISSSFSGKNTVSFLQYLGCFWQETGRGHKSSFRKLLSRICKFGSFSWYHAYIFLKNKLHLLKAEFNAESIGTNFKFQKWKYKKLVCSFFSLFRTISDSWEISSMSVWSRKISLFWKKIAS